MSIRPPVKWHGGKHYLAQQIINHFPPHRIYLEPFGGAASVLLNKQPVEVETYNDLDHRITGLFQVLREHGQEFREQVNLIPYSQAEFDAAAQYPDQADLVTKAVCDFVRWRQSFGGKGQNWSYTTTRARGGRAGDVNAWWTAIEMLPEIIDRLKNVQISCQPAWDVIERFDHPEGLIYCDPPYVHSTRSRGATNVYGVEMSDRDHERLASVLSGCRAKVVLSGYPSSLYERLYRDWPHVEFDIATHAAGGTTKSRQTECLWMNFEPARCAA